MNLDRFAKISKYRTRQFLPVDLNSGNWNEIEPWFEKLSDQIKTISTPKALEQWLLDSSELSAAIDEEGSRRYISMTCQTDDQELEKAYLQFVEQIEPKVKPWQFKLAQLYAQHPVRNQLPRDRYLVFDRLTEVQVALFRDENVPLETEEAVLGQNYQKLSGSLTVQFQGEEKTLIQMGRYLEEPDRPLRQQAWELVAKRRLEEEEKFENFFDQLLVLRQKIALNAGFENYRDYSFKAKARFDYGPEQCFAFHEAIEKTVMPLLMELQNERAKNLQLEKLRPWDLSVDPFNRPPLRPFKEVNELVTGTEKIFKRLDQGLAGQFTSMREQDLLDLANRKGKAPGGYQSTLSESRVPFIFMNAVGLQRDLETLLHEAGHAFHALATQEEDLYAYRGSPIEFCEVASMSMELLGNQFLEEFYPQVEAQRARQTHLEHIIEIFPWIATVDAFQHWIYTNPGHSHAQRRAAWISLMDRFGGRVDWSGYEQNRATLWHRQLHIFLYPFYYVEYGIAQLGALQVWKNSRENPVKALADYKTALALGGSKPLPELFETAGCPFDFSEKTVGPLMKLVAEELRLAKTT